MEGSHDQGADRDLDWLVPVSVVAALLAFLWLAAFKIVPAPPLRSYIPFFVPAFVIAAGINVALDARKGTPRGLDRWLAAIAGSTLMLLILGFFTSLKIAIPSLHPFWLDQGLVAFERGIFGDDPWRISHHFLGWMTPAIDVFYVLWWPIQTLTLAAVMFSPPSAQKTRALICYALLWLILGVGLALAFASVGPIFYDRLYGTNDFAGLAGSTVADGAANILWQGYAHHLSFVGFGISAMPSLHIAIAAWTALVLGRRWFGWLYVAAMWVSSVHLGWHYVSDGFVAIAGALLLWKVAGLIHLPAPRRVYAAAA